MVHMFRWLGRLEGVSFLVLLGIAMPLKYIWGRPEAVRMVGMAHGGLFLGYIALASYLAIELEWKRRTWFLSCVSAVLPFGTFIFESRVLDAAQH